MDREKVIKGLERCKEGGSCDGCQYDINSSKCIFLLHADAIELLKEQQQLIWEHQDQVEYLTDKLKEQEAVEPIKMQRIDGNFSFFVPYFLCGNCRYELVGKDVMFCHHCGRQVKWE